MSSPYTSCAVGHRRIRTKLRPRAWYHDYFHGGIHGRRLPTTRTVVRALFWTAFALALALFVSLT